MLVLGIDPGTVRMGYGLVVAQNEQTVAADWGVVGLAALPAPSRSACSSFTPTL